MRSVEFTSIDKASWRTMYPPYGQPDRVTRPRSLKTFNTLGGKDPAPMCARTPAREIGYPR
jgi:hypothetical protein